MVGEGWKCKVCLGGVVHVGIDDQHWADGGGEALEVGVAVIRDKLKAGEVAVEEGASDEDDDGDDGGLMMTSPPSPQTSKANGVNGGSKQGAPRPAVRRGEV